MITKKQIKVMGVEESIAQGKFLQKEEIRKGVDILEIEYWPRLTDGDVIRLDDILDGSVSIGKCPTDGSWLVTHELRICPVLGKAICKNCGVVRNGTVFSKLGWMKFRALELIRGGNGITNI